MNNDYEKEITENIDNTRNLILLGVRADADIRYLNKTIEELRKKTTLIRTATLDEVKDDITNYLVKSGNPNHYELADISKRVLIEDLQQLIDNLRG